ncbi:hypothetical protein PMZ80_001101 [Knufia obscura]|uniref:RRM domain-containing protein n=2 Tax=Knufia TaxID=430999 RepID=A0AAN8EN13_9EURO|nr:hypothetical protein PMZ80_001101 [Knufia obscura]KAK5958833.1 hypothetical protein OHC33_000677 [Knufia fluminis]
MAEPRDSPSATAQSDFPTEPSRFADDERVSWSKLDSKYVLETEQGGEYEWDDALRRWVAVLDQADLEQQQQIYKVEGVDDNEDSTQPKKKRKKKADDSEQQPKKQRVNTAVYATSIPLDADEDEVKQVFSKYGMIAEEIDSGRPRIKMYEDNQGQFKGDALVVYFRPESVELAVQMLDDSDFRPGERGPDGRMRVQVADYSYKKQTDVPEEKKKSSNRDKQKIMKKTQKMNSKLADWDDDDPQALPDTSSRWDKVVILKHMFTLQELEEDPAAMLEIKEDIREECEKLGPVTNVQLFDKEEAGVASVRFQNATAAEACVRLMNGRWFDERQLQAFIATGKEKFKRSNPKQADLDEDEEEEGRLDEFGSWLEGEKKDS